MNNNDDALFCYGSHRPIQGRPNGIVKCDICGKRFELKKCSKGPKLPTAPEGWYIPFHLSL